LVVRAATFPFPATVARTAIATPTFLALILLKRVTKATITALAMARLNVSGLGPSASFRMRAMSPMGERHWDHAAASVTRTAAMLV